MTAEVFFSTFEIWSSIEATDFLEIFPFDITPILFAFPAYWLLILRMPAYAFLRAYYGDALPQLGSLSLLFERKLSSNIDWEMREEDD